MNEQEVNWFLDIQKLGEHNINKICRKENQSEFLEIVAKRDDWKYNGVTLTKIKMKDPLEDVTEFFSKFTFPEVITTPYGHFDKGRLKTFVQNQLECATTKTIGKNPNQYQKASLTTLTKLKVFLLTKKAN